MEELLLIIYIFKNESLCLLCSLWSAFNMTADKMPSSYKGGCRACALAP